MNNTNVMIISSTVGWLLTLPEPTPGVFPPEPVVVVFPPVVVFTR